MIWTEGYGNDEFNVDEENHVKKRGRKKSKMFKADRNMKNIALRFTYMNYVNNYYNYN